MGICPRSRWLPVLLLLVVSPGRTLSEIADGKYQWRNVKIGGGGGFVPNIIFNQKEKGLAYARTDIGGTFRLNPVDDSWTPLLDWVGDANWGQWGSDALATDPIDPNNLYIAAGLYTNSWEGNNGTILKSTDRGNTFKSIPLPFKVGGNMPGRGMGERLAIDPINNNIIYFGARSGNGLWRSTDAGETWSKVDAFPAVGSYIQNPNDASGYGSDKMGLSFVTFDSGSKLSGDGGEVKTPRIFVGVASVGEDNLFFTEDGGGSWKPVPGHNNTFMATKGIFSPAERVLYLSYNNNIGPYDGTDGSVMKYFIDNSTWVDITPGAKGGGYGYGGLDVDLQRPGTVMVAALNQWWPDASIWRSTDGGKTWSSLWDMSFPPPDYSLMVSRHYDWDLHRAPWIRTFTGSDTKWVGWMIHGLAIDPFDSNHFLYGTGLSLWGSRDLTKWDSIPDPAMGTERRNITLASMADGLEMTAVVGLAAPPGKYDDENRVKLISALGDIGGFVHRDLDAVPEIWKDPVWSGTASSVDYAGSNSSVFVRLSGIQGGTNPLAISYNAGTSWTPHPGIASSSEAIRNGYGGKVAVSADGSRVIWSLASGDGGAVISINGGPFDKVKGLDGNVVVVADRRNGTMFYASVTGRADLLVSVDGGSSFQKIGVDFMGASEIRAIALNPMDYGDLFISTNAGIYRFIIHSLSPSPGSGLISRPLPGVTQSWALAVGLPPNKSLIPTLYVAGVVEGLSTLWGSDNQGSTWQRLTNEKVGLGSSSAWSLACDAVDQGVVYVGTNGRGIWVGAPERSESPETPSTPSRK